MIEVTNITGEGWQFGDAVFLPGQTLLTPQAWERLTATTAIMAKVEIAGSAANPGAPLVVDLDYQEPPANVPVVPLPVIVEVANLPVDTPTAEPLTRRKKSELVELALDRGIGDAHGMTRRELIQAIEADQLTYDD